MAIKINSEPSSSGYQNAPSTISSDILNTTGTNSGDGFLGDLSLNSIFGFNKANSFYTEFYQNLLTTANCPPINALWLVFIQDMPTSSTVQRNYRLRDNASSFTAKNYSKAANEGRRQRGVLLAQGVKHTGDGSNFSREGYKNTGLWKGVLSSGRSEINTLDISFLESNISFVDFALRPWAIDISHRGLTNPELYANNITVWHLSKMGAKTNFAKRKVFKYHNCFPIKIDQQEYNYSGDDINVKRTVSFGYHYYTIEDADSNVLDLLSYSSEENTLTSKFKEFLSAQVDSAVDSLKSQLGANNVSQYLNNIVERGKSFATSVISNTVKGAVTNVAGAVQGAVDGAIRDVTSQGFAAGNRAVSSVSKAANSAVGSISRSNPNRDNVNNVKINNESSSTGAKSEAIGEKTSASRLSKVGYVEKSINTDDDIRNILPLTDKKQEDLVSPSVVDINVGLNSNDTPNFVSDDITENTDGGITITRPVASGNPNADTPIFLGAPSFDLLYYKEIKINEEDVPRYANGLPNSKPLPNRDDVPKFQNTLQNSKPSPNSDDVPRFETSLQNSKPLPNRDDVPKFESSSSDTINNNSFSKAQNSASESNINAVESSFALNVQTNKNDSEIGNNLPLYQEKEINSDDSEPSDKVKYSFKEISSNDSTPSNSIKYNKVQNKTNDSNPSDTIKYNSVENKTNDSNPSSSIKYNSIENKTNDSNPSDTIKYRLLENKTNDSNPSDSIKYKGKDTNKNDSNPSGTIRYIEKRIKSQ